MQQAHSSERAAPVLHKVQLQRLAEALQKQMQPSVAEERLRGLVRLELAEALPHDFELRI